MSLFRFAILLLGISMECRQEQRASIKMCVRVGESARSTIQKIQAAWEDNALSVTQIRFWFRRYSQEPDRNTKDNVHPGRPVSRRSEAAKEAARRLLDEDCRVTVRQVAGHTKMGKTTAHRLLKEDLKVSKIAPKYVLKVLTQAQKDFRVCLAHGNITELERDPSLFSRIIATDESWIFTYDPRMKFADMEWTTPNQPHPRKALRSRSQWKMMLILYFDSHGPISTYFYDDGTIDSATYIDSLRDMREALRRKRPHLWASKNFKLLQDNASPHTSAPTLDYLFTVDMAEHLWPHPQYSPDLSPCNYWAFPLLKSKIRGHRFNNLEDVKTTVRCTLREIPLADFQDCFDKLLIRYRKCVAAAGEYFEGQGKRGLAAVQ